MKSHFLIAANTAITDAQANTLSLIEIVESFEVPQFPVIVPRLTLAWLTSRDVSEPERTEYSIEITNNGEKTSFPVQVNYDGKLRHRAVVQFQGITLSAPGDLEIRMASIDGKRKKIVESLSLPIALVGSQPIQAIVSGENTSLPPTKKSRKGASKAKAKAKAKT
ncbi:DUF6941 family protein [Collimonas sp.]|uniref:DUF6941 family protein n=1 Tax=Collimonas sp. TaxID=1963772 RepID=UPI002CAC75DF|nr:hypothetical protein [Collimonas sp.]HWW08143.1 hypothetical protein [Collimonas sp.]